MAIELRAMRCLSMYAALFIALAIGASCTIPVSRSAGLPSATAVEQHEGASGGEIVRTRCVRCHHHGGTIFSLETAADVESHREMMGHVVSEGFMPAWLPTDECIALSGARRLARRERETLMRWLQTSDDLRPVGGPWTATPASNEAIRFASQTEILRKTSAGTETRCFGLGEINDAISMAAMRVEPDSVPGFEIADVFAFSPTQGRSHASRSAVSWDCGNVPSPSAATFLGSLSRAAPSLKLPQGTGIELLGGSSLVIRVTVRRDTTSSDKMAVRPVVTIEPHGTGTQYTRVRFEHIETVADLPLMIPVGKTRDLRGLVPTGDAAVERVSLRRAKSCVIDLPQWERQFAELYVFAASSGVPLRENDLVELSCRRRETAPRGARANCGFWLLLE